MEPKAIVSFRFMTSMCWIGLLSAMASAQDYGSIVGTVRDANGIAVPAAKVTAKYICSGPCVMRTILPQEQTDSEGHYVFKRLSYGRYSVSAEKPEDGYPPLYLSFYTGEKQREAKVSRTSKTATVDLKLGKKAGTLIGSVADGDTGKPIDAYVEFRDMADPRRSSLGFGLSAQFSVLIPSDTPVLMKVSHPGYEDWSSADNAVLAPIEVRSGETSNLEVKLKKASSGLSPSK